MITSLTAMILLLPNTCTCSKDDHQATYAWLEIYGKWTYAHLVEEERSATRHPWIQPNAADYLLMTDQDAALTYVYQLEDSRWITLEVLTHQTDDPEVRTVRVTKARPVDLESLPTATGRICSLGKKYRAEC